VVVGPGHPKQKVLALVVLVLEGSGNRAKNPCLRCPLCLPTSELLGGRQTQYIAGCLVVLGLPGLPQ